MKIHVLAFDVFIWTNHIRVNGESARASFDWLQEGGSALPSRLQNSVSERIVPKLQAQIKGNGAVHIGLFWELFTLHTQQVIKTFDSLFFYTYRLVLRGQSVLQFSKLLFTLANHRSHACSAFDRILAKTTCQKCKRGKLEVIRMQIIFILCQREVAVSQYMKYTYE